MLKHKTIKFSQNWNNKLDNTVFTTIRKENYHVEIGDKCVIVLNDSVKCWAECIGSSTLPFVMLDWSRLAIDTGLTPPDVYEVFEKLGINTLSMEQNITFLIMRRIENPQSKKGDYLKIQEHKQSSLAL